MLTKQNGKIVSPMDSNCNQTLVFNKKKIGELMIYPDQVEGAHAISHVFEKGTHYPLLIAEPQQGKNGTAIIVIDDFIKMCSA